MPKAFPTLIRPQVIPKPQFAHRGNIATSVNGRIRPHALGKENHLGWKNQHEKASDQEEGRQEEDRQEGCEEERREEGGKEEGSKEEEDGLVPPSAYNSAPPERPGRFFFHGEMSRYVHVQQTNGVLPGECCSRPKLLWCHSPERYRCSSPDVRDSLIEAIKTSEDSIGRQPAAFPTGDGQGKRSFVCGCPRRHRDRCRSGTRHNAAS